MLIKGTHLHCVQGPYAFWPNILIYYFLKAAGPAKCRCIFQNVFYLPLYALLQNCWLGNGTEFQVLVLIPVLVNVNGTQPKS